MLDPCGQPGRVIHVLRVEKGQGWWCCSSHPSIAGMLALTAIPVAGYAVMQLKQEKGQKHSHKSGDRL